MLQEKERERGKKNKIGISSITFLRNPILRQHFYPWFFHLILSLSLRMLFLVHTTAYLLKCTFCSFWSSWLKIVSMSFGVREGTTSVSCHSRHIIREDWTSDVMTGPLLFSTLIC